MARFLSQQWFVELPAMGDEGDERDDHDEQDEHDEHDEHDELGRPGEPALPCDADLVVEVAVSGAPDGDVRYQVVVRGERARVVWRETAFVPAQVEMRSDYATMAGIACGKLSALDALSAGQARISGDIGALSSRQTTLSGLDLVPAAVRASTTF